MSAPDLHPEELLDKAAAGTLSPSEKSWLDTHLAQCSVCRFELLARKDFQSFESPGLNVDNLVARALSGVPAGAARVPARRRGLAQFAVAALVLFTTMASFAAVATVTGVLPKILEALWAPEPIRERPALAPRQTEPAHPEPVEGAAQKPPSPEEPLEVVKAREPFVAPPPSPVAHPAARVEVAVHAPPPPPIAEAPDAGAMFAMANQARVQGDRRGAVRLYGELVQLFPAAEEAPLAQATLGRLLLDSGDPQGALAQLDGYLQTGDATLREEVLAARATALSRLNRPRDEAAAWNVLLESYPDSVHAARARARLADLDAR